MCLSDVWPMVDEAGLEACAGFLEDKASAFPHASGAGSWPTGGLGLVWRRLWIQEVFRSMC